MHDRNTVVTSNDSIKQYDYFILDSGADNHMCNNIELFSDFIPSSITSHIVLGDGTTTRECGGSGTIVIVISSQVRVKIQNVLYVPELT